MRTIRHSIFETNSSSTHCLVISSKDDMIAKDIDESLFLREYSLSKRDSEALCGMDGERFKTIQSKLYYLTNLIIGDPSWRHAEEWELEHSVAGKLWAKLKEIFPNTKFPDRAPDLDYDYLEDGDWLFDESEMNRLATDTNLLKCWFQYGVAYYGSRDDESYNELSNSAQILDSAFLVRVSG